MNIRCQLLTIVAFYTSVLVPANNSISVTNKLSKDMPIIVAFAPKEHAKTSNSAKKRLKYNQTVTIKQPAHKNWVAFTIYEDSSYKSPKKTLAVFNIADTIFNDKKDITIEGVSSNPEVRLNNIDLTTDFSM